MELSKGVLAIAKETGFDFSAMLVRLGFEVIRVTLKCIPDACARLCVQPCVGFAALADLTPDVGQRHSGSEHAP